jgi:hypothetical protein
MTTSRVISRFLVVLLTLIAMSAMSWYWTVINIFRATCLKSALIASSACSGTPRTRRTPSVRWKSSRLRAVLEDRPDALLRTTSALKAAPPAAWVRT